MELFLIIVGFIGVLSRISCADRAEKLKVEIEKVEALINEKNEKNNETTDMIATLNAQIKEDLGRLQIHDDTIREGIDKQMVLIIKYVNDLIEKYKAEEESLNEIEELERYTNFQSYTLAILEEEHDFLKTRRKEGADLECQKLTNNSSVSTRNLRQSSNDVLVYSRLLISIKTILAYTIKRHDLLQRELEQKLQLSADIKASLESKIAHNTDDLVTLSSNVTKLKKEFDQALANVVKLHSRIYELEKSRDSIQAQINQVLVDLEDYERDLLCLEIISKNIEFRPPRASYL